MVKGPSTNCLSQRRIRHGRHGESFQSLGNKLERRLRLSTLPSLRLHCRPATAVCGAGRDRYGKGRFLARTGFGATHSVRAFFRTFAQLLVPAGAAMYPNPRDRDMIALVDGTGGRANEVEGLLSFDGQACRRLPETRSHIGGFARTSKQGLGRRREQRASNHTPFSTTHRPSQGSVGDG
jgi:hypothetical protein